MAFTLILILSMSLLVSVESKSSATKKQMNQAQTNALLGLQVALGQLQKYSGSDTRTTAEAGILDVNHATVEADGILHPHWTGVWQYNESTDTNDLLTWLVSGNESATPEDATFQNPLTTSMDENNSVELLGTGSTGQSNADTVRTTTVVTEDGHYAYWISGQQTKVLLTSGESEDTATTLSFPETIVSHYKFPHLNLPNEPSDSPAMGRAQTLEQSALALGLSSAETEQLRAYYHSVTTKSKGLLTNTKSGGLKIDLTTLLGKDSLPAEYDGLPLYEASNEIESDLLATQAPTWNYLKAYYDLRLDVLDDGKLTPRTGTLQQPGISPVIAMFKYGFGGGLDYDNRILVNLYPQLVLYNPYSVTLQGRNYGLVFFGNQMSRKEEGNNMEYKTMPIAQGFWNTAFHSTSVPYINYEIAKTFTWPYDLNSRTDLEGPGPTPRENPSGAPRFLVECPDIPPGAAVVFTPAARTTFDRYSVANESLTPGFRPHSFVWHTGTFLQENTTESAAVDSIFWRIFDQLSYPIYFDVALVDDLNSPDLLLSAPNTDGVQRYLYRRTDETFREQVFQLTGRIPFRRNEYTFPTTSTYYYGYPNPNPGAEFTWAAYAFAPSSSSNNIHTRPYIHFNPRAKELDPHDIDNSNNDHQHYFYNMYGGANFPTMEFYDNNTKAYIGGGFTQAENGVESFVLYDVPSDITGLYSLGQLQHMQVGEHFDEPGYAFGNSWASPHIPRDSIYQAGLGISSGYDFGTGDENRYIGDSDYSIVDTSYLLNSALWDGYYFSTIQHIGTAGDASLHKPQNTRYQFSGAIENERFDDEQTNAAKLYVDGAFNINSVSVEAWQAVLSGLNGITLSDIQSEPLKFPFFRTLEPQAGPDDPWAGFRELSGPEEDSQIRTLAQKIVEEIKARGPFTSLAHFVNRSLVDSAQDTLEHGLKGALQAAIDKTDINQDTPGNSITTSNSVSFLAPEHGIGTTSDGISSFLTQADILTAIAPIITTRSDTFVIRSYGDSTNPATGLIEGKAWCEATVQRIHSYVNSEENAPEDPPGSLSMINDQYGRRYEIIDFRWLSENEI